MVQRNDRGGEIVSEKQETVVLFRNPDNYIRELVEADYRKIVWDRGYLHKKRIDPIEHAKLYFTSMPFVVWDLGNEEQGCAEYLPGSPRNRPAAVYPIVSMMGQNAITMLEELAANPSGENEESCMDPDVPPEERPVLGQDHIVIVTDLPDMASSRGRAMLRTIRDIQSDYPDCTIHLHGLYAFKAMFSMEFKSVDFEPRSYAQKGTVILPMGRQIKFEGAAQTPQWVTMLDFLPKELADPKNRCIYNIKSTLWAAKNYDESLSIKFRRDKKSGPPDTTSSDKAFVPVPAKSNFTKTLPVLDGDKVACDSCSLANNCRSYRAGAVCSLNQDTGGLAAMFRTRDSATILDGLSKILAKQAERTERAVEEEEAFSELSPDVTKMLDSLFKNGIQFAKLVDPTLRSPKLALTVNGGSGVTVSSERATPQQIMKDVFAALEAQGFQRAEITPEMIKTMMKQMYGEMPELPAADPKVIDA